MKIGWVVLIAIGTFVAGLLAGGVLGTAGGAAGGGLAGACYTAQVAVREGLLTDAQRRQLLGALSARHADAARALQASGDINSACQDLLKDAR